MSLEQYRTKPKEERIVFADILKGVDSSWSIVEKAKYVYDQIIKVSTYDSRLIFGTNPELLNAIYNKKINIDEPINPILICKTLNEVYSQLLERLSITNKIIGKPSSTNKYIQVEDIALVFYDELGREYFTNIAGDLQRGKYRMKTQFFGGCDEKYPDVKREKLTILKEDELKNIDIKTGYLKKDGIYSDEIFDMIASEVKHNNEFKKTLMDLPHVVKEYLESIGVKNTENLSNEALKEYINGFTIDDILLLKMKMLNYLSPHNSTYGAIENKKHSIALFSSVFNKSDKKRIYSFDMIRENGENCESINIIRIDTQKGPVYYRYFEETHQYVLLSIEEVLLIQRDYKSNKDEKLIPER